MSHYIFGHKNEIAVGKNFLEIFQIAWAKYLTQGESSNTFKQTANITLFTEGLITEQPLTLNFDDVLELALANGAKDFIDELEDGLETQLADDDPLHKRMEEAFIAYCFKSSAQKAKSLMTKWLKKHNH